MNYYRLILLSFILSGQFVLAQNGSPLIKNYAPGTYDFFPQNFTVCEDYRGVIYVGNSGGLLQYDGINWKTYDSPNYNPIRKLINLDGQIFYGGDEDFGMLNTNSKGQLIFESFISNFTDSILEYCGSISNIIAQGDEIWFVGEKALYSNLGRQYMFGSKVNFGSSISGGLLLNLEEKGLFIWENENLTPVRKGESLGNINPTGIVEYEGEYVIATRKNGLYKLTLSDRKAQIATFSSPISSQLNNYEISGIYKGSDQNQLIFSIDDMGLLYTDGFERVQRSVNRKSGMRNEIVEDVYQSVNGTIWCATNNGITTIESWLPFDEYFAGNSGLNGNVESLALFRNELYAATSTGIYRLSNKKTSPFEHSEFEQVLPGQTWNLSVYQNQSDTFLLASQNNEVMALNKNFQVSSLMECYPWVSYQSKKDPRLVYLGLDPGLAVIERTTNKWNYINHINGIDEPIRNISEDNEGNLWLGTRRGNGFFTIYNPHLVKDSLAYDSILFYEKDIFLPSGDYVIRTFNNQTIVGTSKGLFKYSNQKFNRITKIRNLDSTAYIHSFFSSPRERLWLVSPEGNNFRFGYIDSLDSFRYELFNPVAKDIIHDIQFDFEQNNIWFGGNSRIIQYKPGDIMVNRPFQSYIRSVKLRVADEQNSYDSLIYGGNRTDTSGAFIPDDLGSGSLNFEYDQNAFHFGFAAFTRMSVEESRFSYKLEGFDQVWSKPAATQTAKYTNLPPGEYTFKVKAFNIFENESKVASFSFSIAKPWYQTNTDYILQSAFLGLLVLITIISHRSGKGGEWSAVITFITIITIFEFIILLIEPYVEEYADGVPLFKLAMNILLALSLNPAEHYIKRKIAKRKGKKYEGEDVFS